EEKGEDSEIPTDPHHKPTIIQPSTSQPQKKQKPRKPKKKDTEVPQPSGPITNLAEEAVNEENVSQHSNDPLLSGEDSIKLNELMELYTKLQQRVLDLENTKTSQAQEITSLKRRVKRLEKKKRSRTHRLKRLYKVGLSARKESSEDKGLADQEDASKQGRKIDDIDADDGVTLVDETQESNDEEIFDTTVLDDEEVFTGHDMAEKEVSTANPVTTAGEVVTTANVEVSTTSPTEATIADELTLAQTLIEIKSAKPKVKGVAKIKADQLLAERLQAREQEELTIEERDKLFQQLLEKRRKFFTAKRVEEKRNIPPTKAQKRSIMTTYLKNMAGYKHNQLNNKSFNDI
ncbi:hypothetical protein Tco_1495498, partial [Tanacetum coccineum]